jgi:hypothetical protein
MPTTCLDIVKSAMKLARVLPSGGTPSSSETTDGMDCLQSMYDEWVTSGMFGKLKDVYLTADENAQEGRRYYVPTGVTLTDATSAYVPEEDATGVPPPFGTDTIGETRQPRDLAVYESLTSTGTRAVKLYDRTAWVDLLDLVSSDEAPLASRGRMGLAACLATSGAFAAMFGDTATMNPDVRAASNRFRTSLCYKLGSTHDRRQAEYF